MSFQNRNDRFLQETLSLISGIMKGLAVKFIYTFWLRLEFDLISSCSYDLVRMVQDSLCNIAPLTLLLVDGTHETTH